MEEVLSNYSFLRTSDIHRCVHVHYVLLFHTHTVYNGCDIYSGTIILKNKNTNKTIMSEEAPSTLPKDQFKEAVKNFLAAHTALKELNKKSKEQREKMNSLKTLIISFMEDSSLEVCKVNHGDKTGELALRNAKRTRALKKDDAIVQIEQFLTQSCNLNEGASEHAEKLWEGMQSSRESMEVKDLSVRKF
jgi:hypothetical protein